MSRYFVTLWPTLGVLEPGTSGHTLAEADQEIAKLLIRPGLDGCSGHNFPSQNEKWIFFEKKNSRHSNERWR